MKKFLVWLFCLILLTQPVFAQSEKLIILNTNTGQNTDADTGQNAGAGEQNSSDTTENTDNVNTQQTGKCGHLRTVCSFNGSIYGTGNL